MSGRRRAGAAPSPPEAVGTVYLVGAGPGDPGLLTRRGAALLRRAGVVVYDALVDPRVLDLCRSGAERVFVGKRAGRPSTPQERIDRILADAARRARVVVRLKGGDPLVFGRGGEEALALAAEGIPFEVVPGVTAALGAAASAGFPLTHRGVASAVTFATGTGEGGAPAGPGSRREGETVVLYMAARRLPALVDGLLAEGWSPDTPAALVEWATWPEERVVVAPLFELPGRAGGPERGSPGVVIVGDVVSLRARIGAGRSRPLEGLRVVVARARAQPSRLGRALERLGARTSGFPRLELVAAPDRRVLADAASEVGAYDAVVFTSVAGVDAFLAALAEVGRDARALAGVGVACFGSATAAAVRRRGLTPDVEAATYDPEAAVAALSAALGGKGSGGARLLLATRPGAPSDIAEALERAGALVHVVLAYDQVCRTEDAPRVAAALESGEVDLVVFPSSSSVRSWVTALGTTGVGRADVAAVGGRTARALDDAGIGVDVLAPRPTLEGLVEAIVTHARGRRTGATEDAGAAPRRARLAARS